MKVPIGPCDSHGVKMYDVEVDECDVALINAHPWYWDGSYVKRRVNGKRVGKGKREPTKYFYLHRDLMQCPEGMIVHHVDGNTRNNTRSNLAITTVSENNRQEWLRKRMRFK